MDFGRARTRHLRLGRRGEAAVCRYLRARGCEVLARNYRPPSGRGELDIVVRDGLRLCFVEVKTRRAAARGGRPAAGLTPRQRRRIRRAALTYLREIGRPRVPWRLDLAEVVVGRWGLRELRLWPGQVGGEPGLAAGGIRR